MRQWYWAKWFFTFLKWTDIAVHFCLTFNHFCVFMMLVAHIKRHYNLHQRVCRPFSIRVEDMRRNKSAALCSSGTQWQPPHTREQCRESSAHHSPFTVSTLSESWSLLLLLMSSKALHPLPRLGQTIYRPAGWRLLKMLARSPPNVTVPAAL